MPNTDMSLERLQGYTPDVAEPADFDEFWSRTLDEARSRSVAPTLVPADTPTPRCASTT